MFLYLPQYWRQNIELLKKIIDKNKQGVVVEKAEEKLKKYEEGQILDREKLEELAKQRMQQIAKKVKEELPEGFGFVVLAFEFDAAPNTAQMMYVSNANRDDVEKAMEEWIEKTRNSYGNDTEKYGGKIDDSTR